MGKLNIRNSTTQYNSIIVQTAASSSSSINTPMADKFYKLLYIVKYHNSIRNYFLKLNMVSSL